MFGVNDTDGERVYMEHVNVFEMMTKHMPIEETGLYFRDEIEVSEGVSVVTEKRVSIGAPKDTVKTYHKVVEMIELNEMEMEEVNKARLFLKKLFEVFFRGKKGLVAFTSLYAVFIGLDIATQDWFGLVLNIAVVCIWNDPIKFVKEIKKMFMSDKKKEELEEELCGLGIGSDLQYVSKDAVKLYYKPRISR